MDEFIIGSGEPIMDQRRFAVINPQGNPLPQTHQEFGQAADIARIINEKRDLGPCDGSVQTTLPLWNFQDPLGR